MTNSEQQAETPAPHPESVYRAGLDGVVAARTRLSRVDGEAGQLTIAGYRVEDLALHATFEEALYLLWHDRRPTTTELDAFATDLAGRRSLPSITTAVLEAAALATARMRNSTAKAKSDPMDALRMAASTLSLGTSDDRMDQARTIIAALPTIVAAYASLVDGERPVDPNPNLGHAANFLYMLTGAVPDDAHARALDTYLVAVCDHGLNASTFAARVTIATESDMVSAVTGAIGALKGPLHGGAPGPALDMVFDILASRRAGESTSVAAERVIRAKLEAGERLMGFGHRIYKVRDPRADVLATAAAELYAGGDREFFEQAREVEQTTQHQQKEY